MSREKWEEHAENEHKCLQDEDLTAIFLKKKSFTYSDVRILYLKEDRILFSSPP